MTAPTVDLGVDPRRTRPPSPFVLAGVVVGGLAAAGCSVLLALNSGHVAEPGLQAALLDWITLPYIVAGAIAWSRRPQSRLGPLMVLAGYAMFLSSLQWAEAGALYTLGVAFDLLPAVLFLHVFLAFPSGRLERRPERVLVAIGYFAAVGLQLVKMLLGAAGTKNVLAIVAETGAANTVEDVQLVTLSAIALAGIVLLAAGRGEAGRHLRRRVDLIVDSFGLGLLMIAALLLAGAFELPAFETIRRISFGVIGFAPVVFLTGLLGARLSRSAVGELLVGLRPDPAPGDLRDAIARALRDPSLTLAFWLPEYGSWADIEGRAIQHSDQNGSRAMTLIERDGRQVAALLHDPALEEEPELLDAVTAAAGIALENGRLHAELRARLAELRGSRERVIEAGQRERERLERNLHDGAQQRLIALSLELGRLQVRLDGDPDALERLERARREVALSLGELRDVARGIHPAVVSGHGLAVALESLAARAAVPVELSVELPGRMQERLEVAAYYVVSESLTNVGKHAEASCATVDVSRVNGDMVVEVVDDGVGGADTEHGTGLRGLADRVEALGGRLRVWTPRGRGTRVRAELPCA